MRYRSFLLLATAAMCWLGATNPAQAASPDELVAPLRWVCPPCGCPADETPTSEPGRCEQCNMARERKLTQTEEVTAQHTITPLQVNILVFPGVQIIDYTAPYEVFGQARHHVTTVGPTAGTLHTNMNMQITPGHHFGNAPPADILVIPGGNVDAILDDADAMQWVQQAANQAKHVLTVCNGAFILAGTGLLNGKKATTFYALIDGLREMAPQVDVITDQRYVDSGKYVTTAGLTSGMDGALHMVAKLNGEAYARAVALNLEYDWQHDTRYARANFADRFIMGPVVSRRYLPKLNAPQTTWDVLQTGGDAQRFEVVWQVNGAANATTITQWFAQKMALDTTWQAISNQDPHQLHWQLPEPKWQARLSVVTTDENHRARLVIARKQ